MKLRRVLPLMIGFVFVPAGLMLSVGILILVFGSAARDYVFGTLIVALVATTVIGTAATLGVIYRESRVARLQTDFVNKVSHDLRTPLTSIRMFVETLQMGRLSSDPTRQEEALGIIAEEVTRLSALINRLLDWARMESGSAATSSRPARSARWWTAPSRRWRRSCSPSRRRCGGRCRPGCRGCGSIPPPSATRS